MTNKEKLTDALSTLDDLAKLLDERVSDLHQVKGGMQSRHAYCYYRSKVWEAQRTLQDINLNGK